MTNRYHAVFSQKMLNRMSSLWPISVEPDYGHIYERSNGERVHVTAVDSIENSDETCGCCWDDLEYRGKVERWIRKATLADCNVIKA